MFLLLPSCTWCTVCDCLDVCSACVPYLVLGAKLLICIYWLRVSLPMNICHLPAVFFLKYHCLYMLLRVCGSCVCNALLAICSFFVGLSLDAVISWLLYVLFPPPLSGWMGYPFGVFCGLYVLSGCWILRSVHFYLDVITGCMLYPGLCTPLPGCVYCLWAVIWSWCIVSWMC